MAERAVPYWLRAGQIASMRSAFTETVSHLQKGLDQLGKLPEGSARDRQEVELQCAMGSALIAVKGYAAPEAERAYLRARALVRHDVGAERRGAIFNGLLTVYYNQAAWDRALEGAQAFVAFAETEGDSADRCMAHRVMAAVCVSVGDFPGALTHGRRALALYDPESHSPPGWRFPHDLGVGAMCQTSVALWHAGYPDQAIAMAADAIALAQRLRHTNTEGYCRFYGGVLLAPYKRREFKLLEKYASELFSFAKEHEIFQWVAWGTCFMAAALTALGRAEEALSRLAEGLALCDRLGNRAFRPTFLAFRAEAHAGLGRADDAMLDVTDALKTAEPTGERGMASELWRMKGAIALGTDDAAEALRPFEHALQTARHQGSRMLELRAATRLATLRTDGRPRSESREVLRHGSTTRLPKDSTRRISGKPRRRLTNRRHPFSRARHREGDQLRHGPTGVTVSHRNGCS